MKNRYFFPILSICLLLVISTCQKETVEQDKDLDTIEGEGVKLNVEQKVIDLSSATVSELQSIDTFEYNDVKFPKYEVMIEGTVEELEKIEPGSVIYIPSGTKGGKLLFVYEVGDTKKSGDQLKSLGALMIKGLHATLDMYFNYENAEIEFSTPDNRSKTNYDYPHKLVGSGLPLADVDINFEFEHDKKFTLGFSSSPQALCKLDISGKIWESGDSYISAEGSLTLHPAIDLFMRYEPVKKSRSQEIYEWLEAAAVPDYLLLSYKDKNYFLGNMKQLRSLVYTDIDKELSFKMHLSGGVGLNDPYRIPLGGLIIPSAPVSAAFDLAFEIDFSLIGELELEYYKKEYYDLVLGVNLHRDLQDIEWIYNFDEETDSGFSLKARVELTTGIYLVLEAEIYVLGILGPELTAKAFMEATAAMNASAGTNDAFEVDWKLTADAGVKAGASLNLSLFHIDKATWRFYSMDAPPWSKPIYLAPASLGIIQGNDQTGVMGQPLSDPITIGAYDSRNKLITYLPVPLYFETRNGSTDPSGMISTSQGIATTTWTLDNETGAGTKGSF